jgi:hypothetical protein
MKLFVAEEKHIAPTINDFETFCSYIDQQRPKLSQRMEVLGKKDVFELNAKLFSEKMLQRQFIYKVHIQLST